jgi:hypothetical protein
LYIIYIYIVHTYIYTGRHKDKGAAIYIEEEEDKDNNKGAAIYIEEEDAYQRCMERRHKF